MCIHVHGYSRKYVIASLVNERYGSSGMGNPVRERFDMYSDMSKYILQEFTLRGQREPGALPASARRLSCTEEGRKLSLGLGLL